MPATIIISLKKISMPPLTYPDEFTFYKIPQEIANDVAFMGSMIESLDADEYENSFRSEMAIKFAEALENRLGQNESAACVLAMDGSDYFGNSRPYDIEDFERGFTITLCKSPFMAMAVWQTREQIDLISKIFSDLSSHPYFADKNPELTEIVALLKNTLAQRNEPEPLAVVAILRSYYLHNN